MNKSFIDREVLLQVKRVYSKDEILADLHRQLKDYGVQVGILQSEIAELKDENEKLRKLGALNRQEEYTKNILNQLKGERERKNKFKRNSELWMTKYHQLLNFQTTSPHLQPLDIDDDE
jgi:predicted RNase H-like nuclease (RuvC/YqgF family)